MSKSNPQYNQFPLTEDGSVDVSSIYAQYMSAPEISWDLFCKNRGWDPKAGRNRCPVPQWRKDKKERVAQERAEELSDIFFDRKYEWNKEVSKTINEYPKAIDSVFTILKLRIQQWIGAGTKLVNEKDAREFNKIRTFEMVNMANAMSQLQAAKYKSLLLHDFAVKLEDQVQEKEIVSVSDAQKPFQIEIMNMGTMTMKDLEGMFDKYLDKPAQVPNDKDD